MTQARRLREEREEERAYGYEAERYACRVYGVKLDGAPFLYAEDLAEAIALLISRIRDKVEERALIIEGIEEGFRRATIKARGIPVFKHDEAEIIAAVELYEFY